MDSLKKQTYLHCLCVILCGFFLLTVSTAQAAPRPTLRVGYTGIPGYIARDYQQRYKGVAYEYLEALATYLGVSLEYVPGAFEENLLRLQTGTIDLLPRQDSQNTLSLSPPTLSTPPGIQPVALGPGAGFALLSSQRPELIQNIKASVQDMAAVNPFFLYQLQEKYRNYSGHALKLSADEIAYLNAHKVLHAMSAPGEAPYTWFNDAGEHKGITADITAIIEKDLDIKIDIAPTDTQGDMLQHLTDGDIDLVTDFYFDYNWGHEHNATLTFPYLTLNYVAVLRRDQNLPSQPIVACPRNHFYTHEFIEKMYPASQLRYYETVSECMAAVNNRQADMTFAKSITAQSDIYQGHYYNLYTNGNVTFSHRISLAISDKMDPILIRILNKEIAHLNQQDISSIVNREIYAVQSEDTLQALLYRNPLSSLLIITAVFTVIILCLLLILSLRRHHARDLYRQANTVSGTDIYNTHWFGSNLLSAIQRLNNDRLAGRLILCSMSAQRLSTLKELYGARPFEDAIFGILRKMSGQDPWFLLYGLSPEVNYILALCRIPDGLTPQLTAELLMREAGTAIVNGTPTTFSYHIGICPVPKSGLLTANVLIDNAQLARNRILGTDQRIACFNTAMQDDIHLQHKMELLMEKALQQEEFKIYLQAKYDIQSQSICAAEALVRWDSPELGFLMPGKFIDLFERNGFAIQLDYYMLEHICRMQRERLEHGKIVIPISVNQSALHITEEGYLDTMESIAEKYQLPAGLVELELTETAFIDYTTKSERNNTRHIVQSLKQMGFSMSIDDFCTGYSSIAMLQTIPANVMKIDRTMLLAAETSDRSLTILRHMVELGHNLNMKVVVEGIETRKQELLLLSIGCNTGQGFLFAKPMPHQAFSVFVEEHG